MKHKILTFLFSRRFIYAYLLLGLLYFLAASMLLHKLPMSIAFFDTLGLMTGEGPGSINPGVAPNHLLWTLAWVVHTTSWVFIPALVGVVVNYSFTSLIHSRNLDGSLKSLGSDIGLSEEKANEMSKQIESFIASWLRENSKDIRNDEC